MSHPIDINNCDSGDSSDLGDSDDTIINLTDYVLGNAPPIYKKTVFDNILFEKHICDSKILVPNIQNWVYNRKVDSKHVDAILKNLNDMNSPYLIGSIKLIRDKATNSLTLLDGQHRVLALAKFNKSVEIEVDVYYIDDITQNDIEIHELFIKANNNKNVTIDDIPEKKVIDLIDKMIEIWPKNIKTRDDRGAYKPNITKKELYDTLVSHIKKTPSLKVKSTQVILKSIIDINYKLQLKPLKELFGRDNPSKTKVSTYERALKHEFFLNLDCKYNLQTWMTTFLV